MSLVVLLVVAQIAVPARARIDEAKQQLRDLKYKEAAQTLNAVASMPGLTRAEALDFYSTEGLMKAGLSDAAGARRSFGFALLLDPEFKLPGKPAPRVSTPFLEAKAWAREHPPLGVSLRSQELGPDHWVLQFAVPASEEGLSDRVLFTVEAAGVSREVELPMALAHELEVREGLSRVTWRLLNARGWVLSEGGPITLTPPVVKADAPVVVLPTVAALVPPERVRLTDAPRPRKRVAAWIALGAVGVGLGTAIAFGFAAQGTELSLQSTIHSRKEADALVLGILGQSTACNIAWVFAGAALITSLILFIVEGS